MQQKEKKKEEKEVEFMQDRSRNANTHKEFKPETQRK